MMTKESKLLLSMMLALLVHHNSYAFITEHLKMELGNEKSFIEKSEFKAKFQSRYWNLDSKTNKGSLFSIGILGEFNHEISPNIKFEFDGGGSFEKGNTDSLFDNSPMRAQSRLILRKAEFIWKASENINLYTGAVSNKDLTSRILLPYSSFLGVKEQVILENGNLKVEANALQSIPSNRNYSNRLDEVNEEDPRFFLESLKLRLGTDANHISSRTSHFAFDHLSNSVAYFSGLIGNSTYMRSQNSADFVYSYQGWTQEFEANFEYHNFRFTPGAEFVRNTAVPVNNQAYLLRSKLTYIKGDKEYGVSLETFRSEKDATVAFYQSNRFYRANHVGQSLEFIYNDTKENLEISFLINQMKEIELNQLNEEDTINTAILTLRKNYEIF